MGGFNMMMTFKMIDKNDAFRVTTIRPCRHISTPRSVWISVPNFDSRRKMSTSSRCRSALRRWPWSRPWPTWSSSRRKRAHLGSIITIWNRKSRQWKVRYISNALSLMNVAFQLWPTLFQLFFVNILIFFYFVINWLYQLILFSLQ